MRTSLPYVTAAALFSFAACTTALPSPAYAWEAPDDVATPEKHVETELPPPNEAPTQWKWYGWQTLIADAGVIGIGAASQSGAVTVVGYLVGAPIVHLAHGRPGAALGSVLLRAALPLTIGVIGEAIDKANHPCTPDEWLCLSGLNGALEGAAIGYVAAVVLDAALLAHENVPVEKTPIDGPCPPREDAHFHIAPTFGLARGGATGGVGGTF